MAEQQARVALQRLREARQRVCPEVTERREHCVVEESGDGMRVWRCEEEIHRFRQCLDGHREEIEAVTTTSVRPFVAEPPEQGAGAGSSAGPGFSGSGPVMSAELGQMLDDFFEYATELQRSLQASGAALDPGPLRQRAPWGCGDASAWQQQQQQPSSELGGGSGGGGLLGRWFGSWRGEQVPAAAAAQQQQQQQQQARGSGGRSLPQLVKEFSSDIQEI